MSVRWRWIRFVPVLLLLLGRAQAFDVRVAAQDTPPKFLREGDSLGGICVEIMRAIEYVDPALHFLTPGGFVSLAKIESGLESGALDVGCALARTPKRAARFEIIDIPLYHTFARLAVRRDDSVEVRSFSDLRRLGDAGVVLTEPASMHYDVLVAHGVRVDASARRPSDNVQKLLEGRGRFLFHNDFALHDQIRRHNLENRVRVLPVLFDLPEVDSGRYFMVSRKVSPELLQHLQSALMVLHKSGELARIFESFRLR